MRGYRRWAFPLVVIGIELDRRLLIAHLFEDFIVSSFQIHLGPGIFDVLGAGLRAARARLVVLFVYWLMLFWMYRRKLFLRI